MMHTIKIWIVDRSASTLSLVSIAPSELPKYRRVRALSDGQWFDAYELI